MKKFYWKRGKKGIIFSLGVNQRRLQKRWHWKVVGFCQTEKSEPRPKGEKLHDYLWKREQFLLFEFKK